MLDFQFMGAGSLPTLLRVGLPDGADSLAFFALLKDFLDSEIIEYSNNLLRRVVRLVGSIGISVVAFWIIYQGYQMVTGRSRESMQALAVDALKIVLITMIAAGASATQPSLYKGMTDGVTQTINWALTGEDTVTVYDDIDEALAKMQLAMTSIDLLDVGNDEVAVKKRDNSSLMAGLGVGGPAVVAGTMLILNKFVMALLIGTGPFFILCMVFKQTEGLFKGWMQALLGTLMSLAFLSVAVRLALDITLAMAGAFWATEGLSRWFDMGTASDGISSIAMMQGIVGMVLTAIILSAPPAAAMLFRGLLANFTPYAQIAGGNGASTAATPAPGSSAYPGPSVASSPAPHLPPQPVNRESVTASREVPRPPIFDRS